MKPFNLEQALAGKKVITRDGQTVTELHLFKHEELDNPLTGIVDGAIYCWTTVGSYIGNGVTNLDLFMKKEKKQYWKNVFFIHGNVIASNSSYPTETEALANIPVSQEITYIKTILIHEEEEIDYDTL